MAWQNVGCGIWFSSIVARESKRSRATCARVSSSRDRRLARICLARRHNRIAFEHWRLGWFVEHHAGISRNAHFRNVQALNLDFERHAISDKFFGDVINNQGKHRKSHEAGRNADEFSKELAKTAAVKEACHFAGNSVPALAIRAVRKEAEREAAPGSVHR